jgi:D-alanyl-D-alanine carboxypeptidase
MGDPVRRLDDMSRRRPSIRTALAGSLVVLAITASACSSTDQRADTSAVTASTTSPSTSVTAAAPTTATPIPPTTTTAAPESPSIDPEVADLLQAVLESAASALPTPDANVQAAVVIGGETAWASTAGPDAEVGRPFRMASVGKTFTAAAVFRLVETGAIGLDEPIGPLLTPETSALLTGDGYDLASITVAHLLQHTSGIYDYAFGDGSPFLVDALADRTRVWTRLEQIELAVSVGDPLYRPGEGFAYSDTGYVLLGEIIEVETGEPYAQAVRTLLDFDRLGITHVWLESGEQAPADLLPMSRSFFGAEEISDLDFSLDAFGGGGLAGTTSDVARFFDALLAGEVFADPETLATMLEIPNTNVAREEFGILLGDGAHGVYRMDVADQTCWSHRGFLGVIALACPEAGVSVALTTNTALTDPLPIATELITLGLAA